jgi:hypothetical protein
VAKEDSRPKDAGILLCIENDEDLLMDESERAGTGRLNVAFQTSLDAVAQEPRFTASAGAVARFERHHFPMGGMEERLESQEIFALLFGWDAGAVLATGGDREAQAAVRV